MKLDSYLSQSRHGIFYFRWPLPRIDGQQRSTVRLSLGTRCPHAAGDLARYLASHGRLIRGDERLAKLRHDEMRRMVRDYFRSVQAKFEERLNSQGLHPRMIPALTEDLEFIEDAIAHQDGESIGANVNFDAWITDGFREHAGLDEAQWQDNRAFLFWELRKARRDQIKAALRADESVEDTGLTIRNPVCHTNPEAPSETRSVTARAAVDDFMAGRRPQGECRMTGKVAAYLAVMPECYGPDRDIAGIPGKRRPTSRRSCKPCLRTPRRLRETRDLTLEEAVSVPGLKRLSVEMVNGHIDTFHRFFDWAERHGYAPLKLFDGMTVAKPKHDDTGRVAFNGFDAKNGDWPSYPFPRADLSHGPSHWYAEPSEAARE